MSQAQDSAPSAPDCQCPVCGRLHKHLQAGTPPMAIAGPSLLRPAETLKPASPSASALDGRKHPVIEFAHAILHGDAEHRAWLLEAADAFLDRTPLPPPRSAARLPAIDGQAWPSALVELLEYAKSMPTIDGKGQDRFLHAARIIENAERVLAAAPPAQGSAGWRDAIEACWQLVKRASDEHCEAGYYDDLLDPIRALAPPVEAQGSERMAKMIADRIFAMPVSNPSYIAVCQETLGMQFRSDMRDKITAEIKAALGDSSPATVEPTIAELQKRVADAQAALAARVLGDPRVCVGMPSPATDTSPTGQAREGEW